MMNCFSASRALCLRCSWSRPLVSRACFSIPATSKAATDEQLNVMRSRLLYQSKKRGILENDIILGEFAEKYLPTMEREDLTSYDKLINGEHMEWDLYYFISGNKEPPKDVANLTVFKMIKKFVDEREFSGRIPGK
ncbi:hypothetical protein KIN20_008798 [Parelaphostrongylus tenuis]|uniref:Succinate dehydrogenase assembly factor 2, mitochondrial n=1 Tax=Parelaphostrongylus tenuis TaxID=148309 RepID=A0AAD5QKT1_PARTN|nr:hypothetical protein KIN20_008798 [Parelaphostrongylus tenuis]